eukprot:SM000075S21978  [mRNA]  locus=s75:423144:429027:+ [translate_table: standard]
MPAEIRRSRSANARWAKGRTLSRGARDTLERVMGASGRGPPRTYTWGATLLLAFQTIGIVYGDIGTSPLYVFAIAFEDGLDYPGYKEDVIGALSIILWTVTISPLLKYIAVVLQCNDNGEGGTFALYSLLCRHLKISKLATKQQQDSSLSNYSIEVANKRFPINEAIKKFVEDKSWMHTVILIMVLTATCMVIGDGALTPAQSVLSAIGGIQVSSPSVSQDVIIGITVAVLVVLFLGQQFGTATISFAFAPIVFLWFIIIFCLGIYNLAHFNGWSVLKAFSPHYGILFLTRNGKRGWIQLGGLFLTITGVEAMFADLGHFTPFAMQLAFSTFIYPCLMVQYLGQGSYLMAHPEHVSQTFYKSIPKPIYWPVFAVATASAAIASQALITATFSLVSQSLALGCFPRVMVRHTSEKHSGQVYIPEVNYLLMVLCIAIVVGLRTINNIGGAYGITVSSVMIITTVLVTLILITVKGWSIFFWLPFFLFTFFFEGVYLSSNFYKFPNFGWVPVAITAVFLVIMYTWHYGTAKKYTFNLENKLTLDWALTATNMEDVKRVPGIGVFYSELISGVPAIFSHFITVVPIVHDVVVFLAIKHVEAPFVEPVERFLIRRLGPPAAHMYRCVTRYGYADIARDEQSNLVDGLLEAITAFIRMEDMPREEWPTQAPTDDDSSLLPANVPENVAGAAILETASSIESGTGLPEIAQELSIHASDAGTPKSVTFGGVDSPNKSFEAELGVPMHTLYEGHEELLKWQQEQLQVLIRAQQKGFVHVVGHSNLRVRREASLWKKILIKIYIVIQQNTPTSNTMLNLPTENLLEIGMAVTL